MNFNFGDIDAMETKFEELSLLIKEHDDISGVDNIPDTIKRAIPVARAREPLRTHLQLNSQSYTTFFEMRQAINQYLKARKGFKLTERDDPMDRTSELSTNFELPSLKDSTLKMLNRPRNHPKRRKSPTLPLTIPVIQTL